MSSTSPHVETAAWLAIAAICAARAGQLSRTGLMDQKWPVAAGPDGAVMQATCRPTP
jgi:hypothetical protein